MLALLDGTFALRDPLVVVFRIAARHFELLLLIDSGDEIRIDCGESPGAEA